MMVTEQSERSDSEEPSESSDHEMDIDTVMEKLGPFGVYQCVLIIVGFYLEFSISYQTLIMVFIGDSPSWRCSLISDSRFCARNFNKTFKVTDDDYDERCNIKRSDWVFAEPNKGFSIVTEYDLVCSKEYIVAMVNAAFFIGWGIGGLFTGFLSDKFGRKLCIICSYITFSIFSLTSSFITAIWQLAILRVLIGTCLGTLVAALVTLLSEVTAPAYRTGALVAIQNSFAVSVIVLSAVAMHIQDWRKLELYATIPGWVATILAFLIPESPRWLSVNGKKQEAESILKGFIVMNRGKQFDFKLKHNEDKYVVEHHAYTYVDLFRSWSLVQFMMAQIFGWLSVGLIYYGVTLESANLGGSIYQNLMYSMIGDIVGTILTFFVCNWFGKRYAISGSFGLSAVFLGCLAASQGSGSVLRVIFAFISKIFINIAFIGFYAWSSELFPTVLRNQGIIFCQLGNRIGGSLAPFITTLLTHVFRPLPYIIMAIFGFLAGLTSLTLPETNFKPTREKYDDLFEEEDISSGGDTAEAVPLLEK